MKWTPSDAQIVQMSHFAIAWCIVATLRFHRFAPLTAMLVALLWALFKEFTFDLIIEHDSLENSIRDFAWYMGGVAVSDLVLEWF